MQNEFTLIFPRSGGWGTHSSFPLYSLSFCRQRATCYGTQSVLSCSVRTPCRPPVSPALHSPSTQTRTLRAFLRGGGRLCFQAFSTPHLRYVFPCTTLCFLYRISFTNGSMLHPRTCLSGSVPFCVCALFVLLIFCLSHPLSNVDKDYQVEFN